MHLLQHHFPAATERAFRNNRLAWARVAVALKSQVHARAQAKREREREREKEREREREREAIQNAIRVARDTSARGLFHVSSRGTHESSALFVFRPLSPTFASSRTPSRGALGLTLLPLPSPPCLADEKRRPHIVRRQIHAS